MDEIVKQYSELPTTCVSVKAALDKLRKDETRSQRVSSHVDETKRYLDEVLQPNAKVKYR